MPSDLKARCLAAAQVGFANTNLRQPSELRKASSHAFKLPIAVAASLLVGMSIGWILRGEAPTSLREDVVRANSIFATPVPPPNANATSIVQYQEESEEETFFTEEIYLCGVGRIQSKSARQIFREQQ